MVTCIAFYRGTRLSDLELVALSTDPHIVGDLAKKLLANKVKFHDQAVSARLKGMRRALRIIEQEADKAISLVAEDGRAGLEGLA